MPNFIVNMRRKQLNSIGNSEHAGLLLDKGFRVWAKDPEIQDGNNNIKQHNSAAHDLHLKAAGIGYSLYEKIYDNWRKYQVENGENSKVWFGTLENRMFLGMGEASPLEAGITLHRTYGVPFIPGSAIKGVISHYANEFGVSDKEKEKEKEMLFGRKASENKKQDSGSAGHLVFNDAWWIPEGKPLAPEIITVHAQKYYSTMGKDAPHQDFESPNPNPQIAIQGSFLFSVEGDCQWAAYGIKLLEEVMKGRGIGAKGASGYGYFGKNEEGNNRKLKKFLVDQDTFKSISKENKIAADKKATYDALSNNGKINKGFEEKLMETQQLSMDERRQQYSELAGKANDFIKNATKRFNESERKEAQILLTQFYECILWYGPGLKKKQKEKQEGKKKDAINQLL